LNRINTILLIFISFILSFLVVYNYVKNLVEKEPEVITVPFKVEVYRADRYPLPNADIYLNQRFIGRTDQKGFFSMDIALTEGESYTLRVEKDSEGYLYGPWETHFKVQSKEKRKKEKKIDQEDYTPSLQGETDIMIELERAQLGRASLYERYHFLAIVDGYMYYTIKVLGKGNIPARNATVIVNGRDEGKTDRKGILLVKYTGEDIRKDSIEVFKEGEHIWMKEVQINPQAEVIVELNKMLLIDLYCYTEYYDVIKGIRGARAYIDQGKKQVYMGTTDEEGYISYRFTDEKSVDGYLNLNIYFPEGFVPQKVKKTRLVKKNLPRLVINEFSYSKKAVRPKAAVMPFNIKDVDNYFLRRRASEIKTRIEDYIYSQGAFSLVSSTRMEQLFKQFNVDYWKEKAGWKQIPLIKRDLDVVIFGELVGIKSGFNVKVYGKDYTGEILFEINRDIIARELHSLTEDILEKLIYTFPFEGNVVSVSKKIYLNLGRIHGVEKDTLFHGFVNLYNARNKNVMQSRVARLRVVEAGANLSAAEVEDIKEGYLLETGVKVRRYSEPIEEKKDLLITLIVLSEGKAVPEANVYLDNRWVGQTGDEGELEIGVKSGTDYEFLIYKDGYQQEKVQVKMEDKNARIEIILHQGKTVFQVDSNPDGALVYIDGVYKGTTPVIKNPIIIPFGYHLVELKLEGYKAYSKYIKFDKKNLSLTGKESITLYRDLYREALEVYQSGNVRDAINVLEKIAETHPDYDRALQLLGFIYYNDIKDYAKAIKYYKNAIQVSEVKYNEAESLYLSYNLAQAYYSEAERLFYINLSSAHNNYLQAIYSFELIRERKNSIPPQNRQKIYLDTLFYLGVCYQKVFYITGSIEYLDMADNTWKDYFDFFDRSLLQDSYFENQYSVAQSYSREAERLKSER